MLIRLLSSQLGLRNSTTRIPFRYGTACLTRCPQATLRVTVATPDGTRTGYSGDCLPPSWFDKSPAKDYRAQLDDMLQVIALAQREFATTFHEQAPFFPGWRSVQQRVQDQCRVWQLPPLLASFGVSLVERAILDATCRLHQVSFARAVRTNLWGITAGDVHPDLAGLQPREWLPQLPLTEVYVRQTVGLGDPLTVADIPPAERLTDGWPQALEEYLTCRGVRYVKVKVSNQLDRDLDRLTRLAQLLEKHLGPHYALTLDGNEQYKRVEEFERLVDEIRRRQELHGLWKNVLAIEQPLERSVALSPEHTVGIRELSRTKPVIIDESDGTLDAYSQALDLGYRGVSSKNCKSALKSLLNAGLTWLHNNRQAHGPFLMTGEDLCSVGIIPTQSDLCLAATLGLQHVERNGHHYHPGLTYLPEAERIQALQHHGDFYTQEHGIIGPNLAGGRFQIGSLQCPGFGFDVEPDFTTMQTPDQWDFASLGL